MLYNYFRKPKYKVKLFLTGFRKAKKAIPLNSLLILLSKLVNHNILNTINQGIVIKSIDIFRHFIST
jgi:hypothetical protein